MKRINTLKYLWARRWAFVLAGGVPLLSLSGCDPTVRNTVLTGIQSSLTTLLSAVISAFFTALQATASTSQPVV